MFFQALPTTTTTILGSPSCTLPFLLLRPSLHADSRACFTEAQKEALLWS